MAINVRCDRCKSDFSLSHKKCPKCGLVLPKKRTYRAIVRDGTKRIVRTTTNLEQARNIESALMLEIQRGEYNLRRKNIPTLEDVWKKYLKWAKVNKKKSWLTDVWFYKKHLEPDFGKKRLDKISQFDIEKLVISMKSGNNASKRKYKPATIRHQLVLMSHLFNKANEWRLYNGDNPCKRLKKPKLNNQKTEFLAGDELARLLKTLDTWPDKMASSIIKFALYTGIRRGELFKLCWHDIDFSRQTIKLRDPKGNKDQALPLSGEATDVLRGVPHKFDTPFVFYGKNGQKRKDIRTAWKAIRKNAQLPDDFRFHGLRHNYASQLVSAGVDLYTVQKLLTHKDAATTQRYAHLADKTLRDAVNLSGKLFKPEIQAKIIEMES